MKRKSKLTLSERRQLYKLRRLGYGIRRIAAELERSPSTVSRELQRSGGTLDRNTDYFVQAHVAHAAARARKTSASQRKMRLKSEAIRGYVEQKLKAGLARNS